LKILNILQYFQPFLRYNILRYIFSVYQYFTILSLAILGGKTGFRQQLLGLGIFLYHIVKFQENRGRQVLKFLPLLAGLKWWRVKWTNFSSEEVPATG